MSRRRPLPSTIHLPPLRRRRPGLLLAAGVLVLVVVLNRTHRPHITASAQPEGDYARYHHKTFNVVKVVDGDTLDIDLPDGRFDTTRIRLWGVDTPEVAGSPRGEMYWGQNASAFAKRTLIGQRVRLELVERSTRGKYKRLLAYVYLADSGEMFNEMLLTTGHAYADTRFAHPRRDHFIALEAAARANRIGLWKDVTTDQMPKWRQRVERSRRN